MTIDDVDEEFAAGFAERFVDTWRSGDLSKHEALWSDDIVLIQPMMGSLRGKQACRSRFSGCSHSCLTCTPTSAE